MSVAHDLRHDEYVDRLVAEAPELSPEQADRLRTLFAVCRRPLARASRRSRRDVA